MRDYVWKYLQIHSIVLLSGPPLHSRSHGPHRTPKNLNSVNIWLFFLTPLLGDKPPRIFMCINNKRDFKHTLPKLTARRWVHTCVCKNNIGFTHRHTHTPHKHTWRISSVEPFWSWYIFKYIRVCERTYTLACTYAPIHTHASVRLIRTRTNNYKTHVNTFVYAHTHTGIHQLMWPCKFANTCQAYTYVRMYWYKSTRTYMYRHIYMPVCIWCMCVYCCIHGYISMCINACMHMDMYARVYAWQTYAHVYNHDTYVCIYVHVCIYMHIDFENICTYVCIHNMYACIHIYTQINMYI